MQPHPPRILSWPATAGNLYFSGPPEADADGFPLQHDRHPPVAMGNLQHFCQGLIVFFNVPIYDR